MSKIKTFLNESIHDGHSIWIFIVPGAILFALFVLPFTALFVRSINPNFFNDAFSQEALKALRLSLITSSVTTVLTIILGTPFAYISKIRRGRSLSKAK